MYVYFVSEVSRVCVYVLSVCTCIHGVCVCILCILTSVVPCCMLPFCGMYVCVYVAQCCTLNVVQTYMDLAQMWYTLAVCVYLLCCTVCTRILGVYVCILCIPASDVSHCMYVCMYVCILVVVSHMCVYVLSDVCMLYPESNHE